MFRAQRFIGAAANFSVWVQEQFQRVEKESADPADLLSLKDTTRAPDKPRDGQIVFTSGTWDPGSGAGFYGRVGGVWTKF
jgi:hypothetical protein